MLRHAAALAVVLALSGASGGARLAAQDDGLLAQGDTTFVIDRVAAVVGNQPILTSQVEEQLFTLLSGRNAPVVSTAADTAALRGRLLEDLINEELLIQEALRDTAIKVTDQEVTEGVNERVRSVRSRFTSEVDYTRELRNAGFQTPDELRRYLAEQQRREFLRVRLMERLKQTEVIRPVTPTDREMREAFEKNRAQFGRRPATISFRQIVVAPKPSAAAKQRAFQLADSIAKGLRAGGDFATAARRFSQDSSAAQGGDLGWQRRGAFERPFDDAVFRLRPGMISDPVETVYGYHVIQVERVQPGEVQSRHILIVPETTPADVDSARALAQRLADAARAGAGFDSLQAIYHDGAEEREAPNVPIEQLPEAYARAAAAADSGAVVGPFELTGPGGRMKFAIVRLTSRRPEGEIAYADVENQLRKFLADDLAERRYLARLRSATYVDIRTH